MILSEFKALFEKELSTSYPKTEIQSFYRMVLEHFLNLTRIQAALNPNVAIADSKLKELQSCLSELKSHKPIQYIIGSTEFYELKFEVNSSVLIPRPETEELVTWVLEHIKENDSVLDIGTGSGCIPISIAKNSKNTKVHAIDISSEAIVTAKKNAMTHKVAIHFEECDILKTERLNQNYNIIISNPPYVRNSEKEMMQPNVLKFEPHLALFVENEDPLLFYIKIAQLATKHLQPQGFLFFEINEAYGKEVVELLQNLNFKNIELRKDVFGVNRMVKAQWF